MAFCCGSANDVEAGNGGDFLSKPLPHFRPLPPKIKPVRNARPKDLRIGCWTIPRFWRFFFVPILLSIPAVLITILLDLLTLRFGEACSKLVDILKFPLFGFSGLFVDIFERSLKCNYFLLVWHYAYLPWPYITMQFFTMAKCNLYHVVERISGMPPPTNKEKKQRRKGREEVRRIAIDMIATLRKIQGDEAFLRKLKTSFDEVATLELKDEDGASVILEWEDEDGRTPLFYALANSFTQSIKWLLEKDADPTRQDFYTAMTGVHKMLECGGDKANSELLSFLLKQESVNFSVVDVYGRTPYMACDSERNPLSLQILRPSPSFEDLEELLNVKHKKTGKDLKCAALCKRVYKLIAEKHDGSQQLHHFRLMDMLFSPHEGDQKTLETRRKSFYDKFLKRLLIHSTKTAVSKEDRQLIMWAYYQSAGPPGTTVEEARGPFLESFNNTMKDAQATIEKKYSDAYERLQKEPGAKDLFAIPKTQNFVKPEELNHSTFMPVPKFVKDVDGVQVYRDLLAVGCVEDSHDFCDLVQGQHRLFPHGNRSLPSKVSSEANGNGTVWRTFLLLWQICLQEKVKEKFDTKMKALADKVGVEYMAAPIKGFERSLEKAEEYALDVLVPDKGLKKEEKEQRWKKQLAENGHIVSPPEIVASMRVTDGLRCSFVVDSVKKNLEIGRLIESNFGVARTKNSHQKGHVKYADRKYNVVFEAGQVDGHPVTVLCEIQVLMREYIEIKEIGHLLYEFQRQPEAEVPFNVKQARQEARVNEYASGVLTRCCAEVDCLEILLGGI